MILRIMGEGQFELSDASVEQLNEFDEELIVAVEAGDEDAFRGALLALHRRVRDLGRPLPPDHLGPSDLVLPSQDATLGQVRGLLGEEGLIPGVRSETGAAVPALPRPGPDTREGPD